MHGGVNINLLRKVGAPWYHRAVTQRSSGAGQEFRLPLHQVLPAPRRLTSIRHIFIRVTHRRHSLSLVRYRRRPRKAAVVNRPQSFPFRWGPGSFILVILPAFWKSVFAAPKLSVRPDGPKEEEAIRLIGPHRSDLLREDACMVQGQMR